uniref:Uncharacterized protein n=1 Tax=Brugia pahangi TaxID=6280 RepID=A0A0N4TNA1_BRUPA
LHIYIYIYIYIITFGDLLFYAYFKDIPYSHKIIFEIFNIALDNIFYLQNLILIKKNTEMELVRQTLIVMFSSAKKAIKKNIITLKFKDICRINIFAKACCDFIKDNQVELEANIQWSSVAYADAVFSAGGDMNGTTTRYDRL